jgi:hypothetical protein
MVAGADGDLTDPNLNRKGAKDAKKKEFAVLMLPDRSVQPKTKSKSFACFASLRFKSKTLSNSGLFPSLAE